MEPLFQSSVRIYMRSIYQLRKKKRRRSESSASPSFLVDRHLDARQAYSETLQPLEKLRSCLAAKMRSIKSNGFSVPLV
jgi:hypothetical protein